MTFVGGKDIRDSILLCQDLFHNYHKEGKEKKCAIKIDIIKAYDFFYWDFLLVMLRTMDFPLIFVNWIEEYISTPFLVCLNKEL